MRTRYKFMYVYAAVSPLTGRSFILYLPWVNTEMMGIYLLNLADAFREKEVLLIMDQAGWHHSRELVVPSAVQIEYLPAYSPELNPVEHLWQYMRNHACRNKLYDSLDDLMDAMTTVLNQMPSGTLKNLCHCSYL